MQKPLLFRLRYELEKTHKSLSLSAEELDTMAYKIWRQKMQEYNRHLQPRSQVKPSSYFNQDLDFVRYNSYLRSE